MRCGLCNCHRLALLIDTTPDGLALEVYKAAPRDLTVTGRPALWCASRCAGGHRRRGAGPVVLIGDDAGHSRNPDEWRCAISAIVWARSATIHGTEGQAWHYREGIRAAEVTGRCLFIETGSRHAPAWAAAVLQRGIPSLKIIPPNGGVHPAEQAVTG